MKSFKTLSLSLLTLAAGLQSASAFNQLYFFPYFAISKTYRQDASGVPKFQYGSADLVMIDGIYWQLISACQFYPNGSPTPFNIDTSPNGTKCSLGSTGVLVTAGVDTDGDGVADPRYYEIIDVDRAQAIEPFRSDKISLYAKPPSTFPLKAGEPLPGIVDNSTFMMYNLKDPNSKVLPYDISRYFWSRPYLSRSEMESEIKPSTEYRFVFPKLNYPDIPVPISFPVTFHHEGYENNGLTGRFRFTNVGPKDAEGFAMYDARLVNIFKWEGFNNSNLKGNDEHYLSFYTLAVDNDASSPTDEMIFPPGGNRLPILPVTTLEYALAPGFLGAGLELVLALDMERLPVNGVASPVSYRRFELPIKFVDTFAGAMKAAFPDTAPASSMTKDADPDGDGIPNWIEWLSGTNPNKKNAPKNLSSMSFVPPSAVRSGEPTDGYWQMTLDRPKALKDPEAVRIEFSTDLKTWNEISPTDPNWTVIDEYLANKIRIISKGPELTEKRYFRVKYKYVN